MSLLFTEFVRKCEEKTERIPCLECQRVRELSCIYRSVYADSTYVQEYSGTAMIFAKGDRRK
jgi:hypothetical protein